MSRLPALITALLLPVAQPLILGTAVTTGSLLVYPVPAQAQTAETVAKIAQAITVRIEGATQGSGVLVKRDGNRYTVLTAWHVVSGQRPGEELDIYTPDGQRHQLEQGSIKRLGQVDMAVLSFSSSNAYDLAKIGDVKSVNSGDQVLVAGFPVGSNGRLRYDSGKLVANAAVGIDQGYQLLYTNDTVSGMSGGVVLKADGSLIGMHGRGEFDEQKSQQSGLTIKTGTNQGVPIAYYSQYSTGAAVVASSTQATTADDYLAQAKALLGKKGSEQEVIRLSNLVLATRQSAEAYFNRAYTKDDLGDKQGAIADYNQAIAINPQHADAYTNRGLVKSDLGDKQGAIADYNQAIAINPQHAHAYNNRGAAKYELGDKQGAIADYNQAIAINPQYAIAYDNRGNAKKDLGDSDNQGAIADFNQAIAMNPQYAKAYLDRGVAKYKLGDKQGAIADYNQAIAINPQYDTAYNNRGFVKDVLGDNQGAIADYNQALAINPQFAEAYNNRGYARSALGDKQGAFADYNQAITINPQHADAYTNRGLVKSDLGDKQGAIADYNQALAISPQHADAYNNRGTAKYELGDKQGAIADYNQALAINPQIAEAYYNRGVAYQTIGNLGKACKDWRAAATLGISDAALWVRKDCQ